MTDDDALLLAIQQQQTFCGFLLALVNSQLTAQSIGCLILIKY